ncbi:hydrogenase maturation protease [Azonexus sp. R2A61]|uniref:hydrogenase maturation protease n=1 Tax=Azonexus sp. R2A61 TaxID=2744443 RepID=UPI001F3DBE76|nr:hydrogenase maturation protease [Azonexus sp. R2A61]
MSAPVVVFAVGNPSRGDDAIGPEICGRLAEMLENRGLTAEVELIEDFQLNIEHALDLCGRRLALFVDAGDNTPGPFVFSRIGASTALGHSTHALPPESVLGVYERTEGAAPPPSFVLCVRGERFALGEALGAAATRHVAAAMALLERLLADPRETVWAAAAA